MAIVNMKCMPKSQFNRPGRSHQIHATVILINKVLYTAQVRRSRRSVQPGTACLKTSCGYWLLQRHAFYIQQYFRLLYPTNHFVHCRPSGAQSFKQLSRLLVPSMTLPRYWRKDYRQSPLKAEYMVHPSLQTQEKKECRRSHTETIWTELRVLHPSLLCRLHEHSPMAEKLWWSQNRSGSSVQTSNLRIMLAPSSPT